MQSSQSASLRTMVARVSPEDIVIYANGALAAYLKVRKGELVGSPLEVLAQRARGEISTCFARPETGRTSNHLVTDAEGRVFEAKSYSDGGVLDIVLDEVTTAESIGRELRSASGTSFESLSEDELRTTRHPERRYLTLSYTRLCGIANVADRLAPMEVRLMVNSFVEEASDAIFDAGCTVGETTGDSVLGIYGAPRYFADHPMRAIRAACDQMQKAANLHAGLYREGKELPPCSCGIWTGDTLVGTLGNSVWQHYSALGAPVELAKKLSELARPGEILVPEHTLTHLLRVLPEGWEHVRAEGETEPDLSDFQWSGDEVVPVAEHLRRVVYLVGPGVKEDTDRVEFYFDYLWAFRVPGHDQIVPILRVMRPSLVGDSLELSNDNVVTTQIAQTLGKYKLVEVIGVGGMGKVWRGVDRFGNSVAIKVLHSNEAVTDAQIKRFRREAEIMAKLPHRNICRVFEMNEFESIHYIAMEFVDGLSLSDLLYEKTSAESSGKTLNNVDLKALIHSLRSEKSQRDLAEKEQAESGEEPPPRAKKTRVLPIEQTLSLMLKVCDAVQFAHEHGALHRDLKPGNILLREDGEPLVADFGLAKMNTPDATRSLSVTGHVVGTLENMSPEQAESSKDVDERADVYSVGTILYQMLTGRRHFEATGNIVADAQALKTHEPQRLRVYNPHIEPDLEIITLKALRNDPVERYRSIAALKADIEHYRRGEVISARPVSWIEVTRKMIQRNKGVAAAVLASCLILIIGTLTVIGVLSHSLTEQKKKNDLLAAQDTLVQKQKAELDQKEEDLSRERAAVELARNQAVLMEGSAKEAKAQAEKAMADLKTAQEESTHALASSELALKNTEEEKDRAKDRAIQAEQKMETLARETEEKLESLHSRRFGDPLAKGGDIRQMHEAFQQANQILGLELSPHALQRENASGQKVFDGPAIIKILNRGLDVVSGALLINRDFVPAWMAKGRFHLALMEFDEAAKSFAEASRAAAKGVFPTPPNDNPGEMQQLAESFARSPGDRTKKAVDELKNFQDPQTQNVAGIIQVLDKSRRGVFGIERGISANEAALSLQEVNGPEVRVYGQPDTADLVVWGVEDLAVLSPLKNKQISSLAIAGAKTLDWPTLQALPVDTLEFSKCGFDSIPVTARSFLKVRTLRLPGTPVDSVDFVRYLTQLQSLDISDTRVGDLAPLRNRSLQELNIAGLDPANLRILGFLPLRVLTLSPVLITDRASLNSLRMHRNIKILRSPEDPAQQTAPEFWRKWDSGYYNVAQ